jgi:hypothetical protein
MAVDRKFRVPRSVLSVENYGRRCAPIFLALILFGLLSAGCTKPPAWEFDELDISRAQLLNELSLGKYEIPIPLNRERTENKGPRRNRLRFDFELHAVVAPEHVSRVTHNWERHEGMIRDRVLRVCRNASLAELQEPELSTLKSRLMDALVTHLGEQQVRRLAVTDPVVQEL